MHFPLDGEVDFALRVEGLRGLAVEFEEGARGECLEDGGGCAGRRVVEDLLGGVVRTEEAEVGEGKEEDEEGEVERGEGGGD